MGGITPKLAKKPDFDVVPNQKKQLKQLVVFLVGNCSYKDSDNSDDSNNSDNDKDNISDNDNSSNMKVT